MYYSAFVCVGESFQRLDDHVELALQGERFRADDEVAEISAFDQLHGDVQLPLSFPEVVQCDEVGMLEEAGGAGLAEESLACVGGFPTGVGSNFRAT